MKKCQLIRVICVLIVLVTFSCKNPENNVVNEEKPKFDLAAAKTAVEARGKVFVDALNKRDSVGLANCYTKDAEFMPPNEKEVLGRENIQKLFGKWLKEEWPTFSMKTIQVWGCADVLAAEEEYTFTDKDGKVVDTGKSLEIFKMEDGVWKLHRDCYNSDMPCPK